MERSSPGVQGMSQKITVDVWSDIVCPWCYVGRQHFLEAVSRLGLRDDVQIHHHAYQLDPDRTASEPLPSWLQRKFGDDHPRMTARVSAVGEKVGLTLDFAGGIAANTRLAHRLVHLGTRHGRGDETIERMMRAHFTDGLDLGDKEALASLAVDAGLPKDDVRGVLSSDRFDEEVQADIDVARELGIRGVPFFVFNRRFALSGAQPIDVFEAALRKAQEPEPTTATEETEPAA